MFYNIFSDLIVKKTDRKNKLKLLFQLVFKSERQH
jgi:hypothetical protein